jgi:biofilm PGA synthesis N-glycosyltransferase PgaC
MILGIFVVSAFLVAYVIVGYPVLLALMARFTGKAILKKDPGESGRWESVTVIIAVRNGERWLRQKLQSVLALDYPAESFDVIVVSDGSTDGTEEIARSFADRRVRLLVVPPGGKPAAVNAAVPLASGEHLFLTDVRQILDPLCLRRLVACMADPTVGVVSGNLRISKGATDEEDNTGLYWRYENAIRHNLSQVDSMLGATGPVYLLRRRLFVPIPPDSLLDDVFLPMSVHLEGYRLVIEEEAIATDEPTHLKSEFRRKVRTQAGILQLIATFPGLFGRRNRVRFHFISLKIGRLMLPWLLLAALVSALLLPAPWWIIASTPQILLWAIAAADPWVPRGSFIKRISGPARAFAVLVFAAVAALRITIHPARSLWIETRTPLAK